MLSFSLRRCFVGRVRSNSWPLHSLRVIADTHTPGIPWDKADIEDENKNTVMKVIRFAEIWVNNYRKGMWHYILRFFLATAMTSLKSRKFLIISDSPRKLLVCPKAKFSLRHVSPVMYEFDISICYIHTKGNNWYLPPSRILAMNPFQIETAKSRFVVFPQFYPTPMPYQGMSCYVLIHFCYHHSYFRSDTKDRTEGEIAKKPRLSFHWLSSQSKKRHEYL